MAEVHYDKDIDINILKGKKIAIIGYGSQGHAHAQNLRDSGMDVVVGEVKDSKPWNLAKEKGFKVYTADEASKIADVIMFLVPDTLQKDIYYKYIEPNLEKGNVLCFAHGFNIHFNQIIPREDIDVIMIAPKGPGHIVRRMYEKDSGVPVIIAVHQDYSKKAKDYCLAYSKALGAGRVGIIPPLLKKKRKQTFLVSRRYYAVEPLNL